MKKIYKTLNLFLPLVFLLVADLGAQSICTGTPGANTSLASRTIVCPGSTVSLSLLNSYTATGITYQWQSSTASSVGPYSNLPGASQTTYTTSPLFTSTYFQCVITCTAVGQGTTSSFVYVVVGPVLTTSTVPCYEDFEGISYTNQLPNCSWLAPNLGSTFMTYTTSLSNNRVPCGGTRFCGFGLPSINNLVYTNGIQMGPGATYSAAVFYKTDYLGSTNWTQLELLVGPNQTTTGLVQVASVSPAISGPCKLLSGTFTVPSSGLYYVAVRANAVSGSALYLTLEDLSVTAPCNLAGNSSTLTIVPNNTTFCEGSVVSFTASGASTYTWSSGAVGPVYTTTLSGFGLFSLSVSSSNTVNGCTATGNVTVGINPSPNIFAVASPPVICPGETARITGYGASSYTWGPGLPGNSTIAVSPTVTTCYTLTGVNSFSCPTITQMCITVNPSPTLTTGYSRGVVCPGEEVILTGGGALVYQWWNGFSPGNPVTAYPLATTLYSVTGTNAYGCKNTATISVTVNECVGLKDQESNSERFFVHPNPGNGEFIVESGLTSQFNVLIYDALGRLILQQQTEDKKMGVSLRQFPNGIYYLKIETTTSTETFRVIKE